ncbi:MAG: acylneuraminate cytidylyltransferase [bacterium]|nr:acylneuraminate cytidylyltransferase [bacterium]
MRDLGRIVMHIPARAGSKRVKSKNLRYIAGAPLLSYTVNAALNSRYRDMLYVNTESGVLAALAEELGAKVYKRPPEFSTDTATSDQYNMDIIDALNPDTLVQINPVCPLLESGDIEAVLEAFKESEADTLITSTTTQMQCFCRDEPVNIRLGEPLAPSQQNPRLHICNWAVTVWDAHRFRERYQRLGFAVFGERRELFPIHPLKAIKISNEEDFTWAEFLLERKGNRAQAKAAPEPVYWEKRP